jgi:hypothetical protein
VEAVAGRLHDWEVNFELLGDLLLCWAANAFISDCRTIFTRNRPIPIHGEDSFDHNLWLRELHMFQLSTTVIDIVV